MKAVFIAAIVVIFAGCIDPISDKRSPLPQQQANYVVTSSTIERFRIDSNVIELYEPGAHEVRLYDPTTGRMQTAPADPGMVSRLFQGINNLDSNDAETIDDGGDDGSNSLSCSSKNGAKDCFCTGNCCRTETTCTCTC